MADEAHNHTVIPFSAAGGVNRDPKPIAPFRRPRPLAEKLAAEPLITAAVCVLIGAVAANIWAHRFGRTRARLEREALHKLDLAQRLDPFGEPFR
jgi:hypothetical protein